MKRTVFAAVGIVVLLVLGMLWYQGHQRRWVVHEVIFSGDDRVAAVARLEDAGYDPIGLMMEDLRKGYDTEDNLYWLETLLPERPDAVSRLLQAVRTAPPFEAGRAWEAIYHGAAGGGAADDTFSYPAVINEIRSEGVNGVLALMDEGRVRAVPENRRGEHLGRMIYLLGRLGFGASREVSAVLAYADGQHCYNARWALGRLYRSAAAADRERILSALSHGRDAGSAARSGTVHAYCAMQLRQKEPLPAGDVQWLCKLVDAKQVYWEPRVRALDILEKLDLAPSRESVLAAAQDNVQRYQDPIRCRAIIFLVDSVKAGRYDVDQEVVDILRRCQKDEDEDVRGNANWALAEIGGLDGGSKG